MKKRLFSPVLFLLLSSVISFSQLAPGKLAFEQGKTLEVTMKVNTTIAQQAMGQAIDFNVDAAADHFYKVTNATDENTTLNHGVSRIIFSFDGMGQKRKFDSNKPEDMNSQFAGPVKEILQKKYDIIIDTSGNVLMAVPASIELTKGDSRMAIISSMLKDVLDLVQPPQKGKACFFGILPGSKRNKGDTWTTTSASETGKTDAAYVLSSISDTAIIIDFAENSVTVTKAEMMGSETTTTMNNKSTGKIVLDPVTGILREKTFNTESNGNTESSFGTMPVTSKTTTVITVKPSAKD